MWKSYFENIYCLVQKFLDNNYERRILNLMYYLELFLAVFVSFRFIKQSRKMEVSKIY